MLEIRLLTTDQTFVEALNSAGIDGVRADYDPTMAYDTAEHICEIVIRALGPTALTLAAQWVAARWRKEKPKQASINNHVVANADQVVTIINNYITEKQPGGGNT